MRRYKSCSGSKNDFLHEFKHSYSQAENNILAISTLLLYLGIIRDTRGRITSPNFPQNYAHTSCTWIIRVRSGRTINVVIRTLDIYKGPQLECSTDRLIVKN